MKLPISTGSWAAIALSAAVATPLSAQGLVLEEVMVTATKRTEGLQDVPISLSVMSGEKIIEQGISSLEELAVFIPNVHISESMGGDQLFIRGVGSGENYGFEQSVGTFVDGIYFGRGQSSRSSFLDIERVEILKGPQSTLFGKNTVAGAINITTARPTEEFMARIEMSLEPEFDAWSTTGTVSGAISDTLNARLVLKREETDGYMENTLRNRNETHEKNTIGRMSLNWLASEEVDVLFKYEYGESDTLGRHNAISIATPQSTAIYQAADPDFNAAFNYHKSSQGITEQDKDDEFQNSEWNIASATIQWALGENTLRSITGYVDYEFSSNIDADLGPLKFLARGRVEQHKQFSQEFLLSSPQAETLEYLAGLYYQEEDLQSDRTTDAALSVIGLGDGSLDSTSIGEFQQDSESLSAFTQLTWNATDSIRAIAGVRYSRDEKEFTKYAYTAELFGTTLDPVRGGFADGALNFLTDHSFDATGATRCVGIDYACTLDTNFDNKRSESHVTGDLTLQWDASDAVMTYAKVGNGYKAGGFDEANVRGVIDVQEFEDETVITYEIGAKMDLLEGRGRLNLALFHSEFKDVQVSAFDGNSAFVVDNAAESESQGLEADGSLLMADSFRINAGFAYLDATYSSFPDAACTNAQALALVDAGGERNNCVQDLSGKSLQYSPKHSGNVSLEYFTDIGSNLEFKSSVELLYSDDYEVASDLDSNLAQEAYTKWNARMALGDAQQKWNLAVVFKNITNEKTTPFGADVPLAELGFDQTYLQFIDPPRSVEFQALYNF
ncbi:MAG: iron complex outermembrane receptor protein [Halioglobus sp.]|jgi:iron complex outermembrane receptor protein